VCDHDCIPTELHKLWQDRLYLRCIDHHIVSDGSQFLDPVRDRHFRVDERRKTFCDLAVHHFHCTDLYDLIFIRRKSGRLKVKHHIGIIEILVF